MKRLIVFAVLALMCASPASAQYDNTSWGVSGSIVPTWTVPSSVKILFDADSVDIGGAEFRIGVARGRTYGGDWGISYLHKTVKQGAFVARDTGSMCFNSTCYSSGERFVTQDVRLDGLEIYKFVSFVTIKRRAQIGMNFAGGVAWSKGVVIGTYNGAEYLPSGGIVPTQRTEQLSFNDLLLDAKLKAIPLGKIEIGAAAILAPGLKVRFSGGFNFPGYHAGSVTLVYLFGSR